MTTHGEEPSFKPPRTPGEMLTAHLLALLKGWSGYGYELSQRLEEAGLGNYNSGTIYRTLRQMEKMGFVSSLWDTSADGPARRMYTMTTAGNLFLEHWIQLLESHRAMLEQCMRAAAPEAQKHAPAPARNHESTQPESARTQPAGDASGGSRSES